MIVVVTQFCTDGDFCVDGKQSGLVENPENDHDHCGTFLCADTEKAEAVLERVFKSIDADGFNFQWFISAFAEALRVLREEPETLQRGWCKFMDGNYRDTHLFMQSIPCSGR